MNLYIISQETIQLEFSWHTSNDMGLYSMAFDSIKSIFQKKPDNFISNAFTDTAVAIDLFKIYDTDTVDYQDYILALKTFVSTINSFLFFFCKPKPLLQGIYSPWTRSYLSKIPQSEQWKSKIDGSLHILKPISYLVSKSRLPEKRKKMNIRILILVRIVWLFLILNQN